LSDTDTILFALRAEHGHAVSECEPVATH